MAVDGKHGPSTWNTVAMCLRIGHETWTPVGDFSDEISWQWAEVGGFWIDVGGFSGSSGILTFFLGSFTHPDGVGSWHFLAPGVRNKTLKPTPKQQNMSTFWRYQTSNTVNYELPISGPKGLTGWKTNPSSVPGEGFAHQRLFELYCGYLSNETMAMSSKWRLNWLPVIHGYSLSASWFKTPLSNSRWREGMGGSTLGWWSPPKFQPSFPVRMDLGTVDPPFNNIQ